MEPLSQDSINEMKRRGYDPSTISAEQERLARYQAGLELIPIIESAFSGVTLGDGMGLYEAQGLDDYADEATCAEYRARDEKNDWRKITHQSLRRCNSSLSFFNAEGMRFHLPAYLVCDLKGDYGFDLSFTLTNNYPGKAEQFSLFSPSQHRAVRLYLLHLLEDPNAAFYEPHIKHALDNFWVKPSEPPQGKLS